MVKVMCPRCGKLHQKGQRCPCSPSKSNWRRSKEQERGRKADNPWRTGYSSKQYQQARQTVMQRQMGLCAITGERVADWDGKRWVIRNGKGGVHHIVPLSQGGNPSDVNNLVLLSVSAHNKLDAINRRKLKGGGGSAAS